MREELRILHPNAVSNKDIEDLDEYLKEVTNTEESKVIYETDTPVQGEYREPTLSALAKFQAMHEETRKTMSDKEKTIDERMFNYFFPLGTLVTLDKEVIPTEDDNPFSFTPNVKEHIGKVGVVTKYYSDLHAFGRGHAYNMDVQFEDELLTGLPAYYIIKAE